MSWLDEYFGWIPGVGSEGGGGGAPAPAPQAPQPGGPHGDTPVSGYHKRNDGSIVLPSGAVINPQDPKQAQELDTATTILRQSGGGFEGADGAAVEQYIRDTYSNAGVDVFQEQEKVDFTTGESRFTDPLLERRQQEIERAYADNQRSIAGLDRYGSEVGMATMRNNAGVGSALDQQARWNDEYIAQTQGLTSELMGYRDTANADQARFTGNYHTQLNDLSNYNTGLVNNLGGLYGELANPLQSQVRWEGDLVSQAAQADQAVLAQQNQALGFLSGASQGSLDYQSQAAKAYADPKYLAMRDKGLADLYAASQGSKDVHVGDEDPEAYAAAMDALKQMGELTDPTVTDKERFLYEKARQGQEMDERALSAARMSDLRRRGMAGSGAELTQNALDSQRISQNRLLSDLGASAGAVDRASVMLQNYGALGSNMNAQANQLATGNADRQLGALGAYTEGSHAAQASSFDQAYARGAAADKASSDNQSTRLQGGIAHGQQANTMQQQHFQRASAADQTAQFNRAQSLDVSKFNTDFAQRERDAQWNRGLGLTQTGLQASSQNATNARDAYNSNRDLVTDTYGRNRDVITMKDTTNTRQNSARNQQTQGQIYMRGLDQQAINDAYAREQNYTGMTMNNNQFKSTGNMSNIDLAMGANAADAASRQALALADANKQTSILWGLASW